MKNEKVVDATIQFGNNEGDRIFWQILDDLPELEQDDCRRMSTLFTLFCNCIQYLHINGYSEKELVNEVFDHCKIGRDIVSED